MPRKLSGDDQQAVLTAVYGPLPWDLTREGVADRLSALRRGEGLPEGVRDPKREGQVLAKRFERLLRGPLGRRLFPAQGFPWQETSQGLRVRLALLPKNPHLELDVRAVRQALGIPEEHLRVGPRDAVWKRKAELAKPAAIRGLAEDELAHEWLSIHREAAAHRAFRTRLAYLLRSAVPVAEASAAVDLASAPGPEWLRTAPAPEAPRDVSAPIDRAVARLIERHRLPPTRAAARRLTRHLLTGNPDWLTGWNLSMALVRTPEESMESGYDSRTVTVVGLDAFVTREDWAEIWERVVEPSQSLWMRSQGQPDPRGPRGVQIAALEATMPLYRAIVLDGLSLPQARQALQEKRGRSTGISPSTDYRGIRALRRLLEPGP